MVRWPAGLHRQAGSVNRGTVSLRRIPVPHIMAYDRLVTVDLSDDGIALPVTISAGGTGTAFVGPATAGESWALDQGYVSTSIGQLDAAIANVYAGAGPISSPVSTLLVAGTLAGGGTQFGFGGIEIQFGEFVIASWSAGTAGSIAQLRVTGTKTALASRYDV